MLEEMIRTPVSRAMVAACRCAPVLMLLVSLHTVRPGGAAAQAARSVAEQVSDHYASIASAMGPAVVTLLVELDGSQLKGFFGPSYGGRVRGSGSGVVVRPDGAIVTNHHVVEHAQRIEVEFQDGRKLPAKLLGADAALDLALLRVDAHDLKVAPFADSRSAHAGDWVVAIGAPFGLRHSVTAGVISAVDRMQEHLGVVAPFLQTDANINPGNSGGPLVNLRGEVLGINTAYVGAGAGIGFSIPANLVRETFEQLLQHGRVERGYLGLRAQALETNVASYLGYREARGALIQQLDKDGPAQRAGVLPGDIVTRYAGAVVKDGNDLLARIAQSPVSAKAQLELWRRGKLHKLTLSVASAPSVGAVASDAGALANDPMLGLKVRALSPDLRQELGYQGEGAVVITQVVPGSPAARAGLNPAQVILEADLKLVTKPRDLLEAIEDKRMLLRVEDRHGEASYVLLEP
jgi:serine protease Do